MQIEIIDRFVPALDDIAAASPGGTFYHTGTWIGALIRAFPQLKFRCIVATDAGVRVGFLPYFVIEKNIARRVWSMPFGTYGGPVATGGAVAMRALLDRFLAIRGEPGVHEVGLVDYARVTNPPPFDYVEALTHIIPLSEDFDQVWSHRFEKSKRRQTRKAEREGIVVREAASVEEVRAYYSIYERRSEVWQQRLKYPEVLFVDLFNSGNDCVRLFLAYLDDELLGGHFNFYFGDTVIAWNGVTTEDSRGIQAGTLLYTACIRDACRRGFRHYNLGGSLGISSLVEYKQAIGGEAYTYPVACWRSLGGKIAAAVLKYLPGR